jgi:UDP-GlcNAc3NAcA epimerase
MSAIFFRELEIPEPHHNLEVGSGSHAHQTGEIMRKAEELLISENPDLVLVYGDTNSTLAGALAASKLHIPVAHVEAGLRSFNKSMPEEINRIVCDHLSTFLFSPTKTGYENLMNEGFESGNHYPYSIDNPAVFHCGDVMLDNALYFLNSARSESDILMRLKMNDTGFILCTIHRNSNTDLPERLNSIFGALDEISRNYKIDIILPLHPRTAKMIPLLLEKSLMDRILSNKYLNITKPVSYFDMLVLESRCRMVITDSGGVQKESFFFRKPCLVLRPESEWKELIELGTAIITDADPEMIIKSFDHYYKNPPENFPAIFGDGRASEFILHELVNFIEARLQD